MAALPPNELLRLWAAEQIPPEHAIGQLMQHIARMQQTLESQQSALAQLQRERTLPHAEPTKPQPRKARN